MASKSKRNQAKFKWTKELIFLIVFIVGIIAITVILAIPSSSKRTLTKYNEAITAYNTENSTSYSTLSSDNVYEEISGGYDKQVNKVVELAQSDKYTYVFYGALSNATFLEQLSNVNAYAKNYEIEKVYVFLANYVTDAEANQETSTSTYNNKIKEYNNLINKSVDKDCKEFDMATYPALLAFKDGKLVYNTQIDTKAEYTWNQYINKVFGLEKLN